jgi:small-conductance mechanosensitive channel
VNRAIWRVFKERGIKIPVAQRELRMLDPERSPRRARDDGTSFVAAGRDDTPDGRG